MIHVKLSKIISIATEDSKVVAILIMAGHIIGRATRSWAPITFIWANMWSKSRVIDMVLNA
jgi:hypothetical protein